MRKELTQRLFETHPRVFRWEDGREPLGGEGIRTRDGWYDLIDTLCERLESLDVVPRAVQVKEKFGGLRFYAFDVGDVARAIIDVAESKSFLTCDRCGTSGRTRNNPRGWIVTVCDACYAKEFYR